MYLYTTMMLILLQCGMKAILCSFANESFFYRNMENYSRERKKKL